MKKILSLLICGLFIFNATLTANAGENLCTGDCITQSLEDYVDPNWISVANGNTDEQISTYSSTKNLFVTSLYQNGITDKMQTCGYTIGSSGCTLTSATMVSNFLNGTSLTPQDANSKMGDYACPFYWYEAESLLDMDLKLFKSDDSGLSASYYNPEIYTQLNNNVPIIVGMKYNNTTHFVVVKGYNYDGSTYTFYISDPNRISGKTTLNAYISSGAIIHRLAVYGK